MFLMILKTPYQHSLPVLSCAPLRSAEPRIMTQIFGPCQNFRRSFFSTTDLHRASLSVPGAVLRAACRACFVQCVLISEALQYMPVFDGLSKQAQKSLEGVL
jgi:hypothetical protein